jgi:hypothetical protein
MGRPRVFACYCDEDAVCGAAFANQLSWECGLDISSDRSWSGALVAPTRMEQAEQEIARCQVCFVILTPAARGARRYDTVRDGLSRWRDIRGASLALSGAKDSWS